MIIKNSMIYLGSGILSRSLPFLLMPIMTKYLSPEEYGLMSVFFVIMTFYSAFIGMNIHANISKNFYKIPKEELSEYIGNMFYILIFTFLLYLLITYVITTLYIRIFSIPTYWLFIIPFISVMMMINDLNTTILRNEQRAYMFGVFEVSNMFIKMSMTILFLLVFSFGWYSQVLGTLIGAFVFFFIGIWYMSKRDYINMKFNIEKIKSILNISIPFIPHVLGGVIIAMSDRLFIEMMIGLEAVGIYTVGYSFGMLVMIIVDSFIKAWSPWFYKSLVKPTYEIKIKIVKYTYFFIIGIFIIAFLASLLAQYVLPYIVDEKFYSAEEFIFWVAIGYAIRGVYQIFFPYLVHISRTSFLAISTVIAAIINLILNYLLIDLYGAIGAAYATALAFAVSAVLVVWYQQKNYYMPWFFKHGINVQNKD